jgi:hypothetical protein
MAKLLKLRRGTTTQHSSFTGAEGEVTIDTTKDTAVVHDGSQAGGRPLLREDLTNLATGGIATAKIADDAVTADKLANTAVTAGSYTAADITVDAQGRITAASSGAIATSEITDAAVTTAKIGADAVTNAKIADDSIDSEHYVDGSIDTAHIADDQVTYAKIQNVSATDRLLGRDSSGAGIIEEIAPSAIRTMINVEDGATADQTGAEIASALNGQNIYTTGVFGRDSTDYIGFANNAQMDIYINGNNEFRFEADGDFHADGDVIAQSTTISSDRRLKENIEPVSDALKKVQALNGVSFDWKKTGEKSAGVIAQEVIGVLPEAVKEVTPVAGGGSHLAVNYHALTSILIEAIKELKAELDEHKGGK